MLSLIERTRGALRQWYADRTLRQLAPRIPSRIARAQWAAMNASERGRMDYQTRVQQFAMASGGRPAMDVLALAQPAGWTPEMLAGIPQPDRRSTTYPVFAGLGHGRHPGLRRLPKPTPFNLRRFSEAPPCRRAINKIKNALLRLDWEVVPRDEELQPRLGRHVEIPLDVQQRIDAVTRALRFPNSDDTYLEVMTQLIEDVLVGGFGALEVQPWQGNALQPFRAWAVDGMSIRINMDWQSDDDPNPDRAFRYSQALAYGGGVITTHERVEFYDKELLYLRCDPRTNTPFGLGPTEVAFQNINAYLGHMDARERMESNDTPAFGLQLGEDMSKEDVEFFRAYWENQIEGMGKIPIIGGTKSPEVLQFRLRQMGTALDAWPNLILRMIANSFGLAPQTLGLERDVNRNTSDVLQSEEFADAVLPHAKLVEDGITQHCIWKVCEWDDLEFKFKVTVNDEKEASEIAINLFNSDIIQLNEAREKASIDPLPDTDPRGALTLSELRAQIQAQYAPPAPSPGLDPMGRMGMEEQPLAPEPLPPQSPQEPVQEAAEAGADAWMQEPVHAPPLGSLPSAYASAETDEYRRLITLSEQLRVALAASSSERVGIVVENDADFELLTQLIATHGNGHA